MADRNKGRHGYVFQDRQGDEVGLPFDVQELLLARGLRAVYVSGEMRNDGHYTGQAVRDALARASAPASRPNGE